MAVYDTFLFFNETDLLEIRLHELNDVVDRFVLVESTETFSGQSKPLYYGLALEHERRFDRFRDKISRVIVDDMPAMQRTPDGLRNDPWPREYYQRDQTMVALKHCQDNDIIMISDVDEIPRATKVAEYKQHAEECFRDGHRPQLTGFSQRLFYYWFNCCCIDKNGVEGWWGGTKILTYRGLLNYRPKDKDGKVIKAISGPDAVRRCGSLDGQIGNGGWHFSYQGGIEQIRKKIAAYSHSVEFDKWEYTNQGHLEQCLKNANDLFNRPDGGPWGFVPFDDSYPEYVKQNREKFAKYIAPHAGNKA